MAKSQGHCRKKLGIFEKIIDAWGYDRIVVSRHFKGEDTACGVQIDCLSGEISFCLSFERDGHKRETVALLNMLSLTAEQFNEVINLVKSVNTIKSNFIAELAAFAHKENQIKE